MIGIGIPISQRTIERILYTSKMLVRGTIARVHAMFRPGHGQLCVCRKPPFSSLSNRSGSWQEWVAFRRSRQPKRMAATAGIQPRADRPLSAIT